MTDRIIIVTGCSSGIGRCLAYGLQEQGYRVLATCRREEDCRTLEEDGISALPLDLQSSPSVQQALLQIHELSNGKVYALVNNGGYGQPGALEDLDRETLRAQFETNVFGTQELTNGVIPWMRSQGEGRIIQISSVLGIVALRFRGAYTASKFALEAMSDTLRLELHGSGIHVSLIEPGPISSRFRNNALQQYHQSVRSEHSAFNTTYTGMENRLRSQTAARHVLPPEAVLECVLHALSARRPRIRYRVTLPTRIMGPLKRLLPDWLMDRLLLAGGDPD
jgi:NAD(P)-dependent dehydrogenase (short-subunit alcohol dehydrogenase family)